VTMVSSLVWAVLSGRASTKRSDEEARQLRVSEESNSLPEFHVYYNEWSSALSLGISEGAARRWANDALEKALEEVRARQAAEQRPRQTESIGATNEIS
jgi:hypothetical protein